MKSDSRFSVSITNDHPLRRQLDWVAVVKAGLIAGAFLLLLPLGFPWAAETLTTISVIGRPIPPLGNVPAFFVHMGLVLLYSAGICALVRSIRSWMGILCGAVLGLTLYFVNCVVVILVAPDWLGAESRVVFAHVMLGLVVAACYKGLARGNSSPDESSRHFHGLIHLASFDQRAPAEALVRRLEKAGLHARAGCESLLQSSVFWAESHASEKVYVEGCDFERARELLKDWEQENTLSEALHCPECRSVRVEYPQYTRKFVTPLLVELMVSLGLGEKTFYCADCHFTWPKQTPPQKEVDVLGFTKKPRA